MPCTKAMQVHLHKRKLAPLYLFFTPDEGKPLPFFFLFFFFSLSFPSSPFSYSLLTVPDTASQCSVLPSGGGATPYTACLLDMSPSDGGGTRSPKRLCRHACGGVNQQVKGLAFCCGLLPLFLSLSCLAVNIFCNLIARSSQ